MAIRAASSESSLSIKDVFTRVGVARMSKEAADRLVERVLKAIGYWCALRQKGTDEQQRSALTMLRVQMEVLARLVVRVSPEKAKEIFRLAISIGKQQDFQHLWLSEVIGGLITHSQDSIPKVDRGDLLPDILDFPLQCEVMGGNFPRWPNPTIDHLNARATYLGLERRIDELIGAVATNRGLSRGAALERLLPLARNRFLADNERQKLACALWGDPPDYRALPSSTNLLPYAMLFLPASDPSQVKRLVYHRLYEHGEDLLTRTQADLRVYPSPEIDEAASTYIGMANAAVNDATRLFPTAEHALVLFDRLVMELIRFYFGSSSQLLQRLWSGPITPEKFWSLKQYEPETGHLHLKLADGISKASAADIGRMALSEYAWKKADSLYRYCAQEAADGLPGKSRIYPIMGFPFQGRTSLTAVGTWLPYLGRPRSLFVVSHLRQCTHPFPFRSLSYELGRPLVRRPSKTSPEGASPADQEKRKTALVTRAAHQTLGDDDPGRGKSLLSIEGREGDRFPDLTHKPLWEEYKVRFGNVDVFVHRKSGLWEQVGFGTPEGTSETRAVEASVSVRQSTPPPLSQDSSPLPHWLKEGIERKCKALEPAYPYHPVKVERIVLPGRMEALFPLPLVVDEDGVIDPRGLYRGADGHERPRLACFVRFSGMENCAEPVIVGFVEGAMVSAPCSQVLWHADEETDRWQLVLRFLGRLPS